MSIFQQLLYWTFGWQYVMFTYTDGLERAFRVKFECGDWVAFEETVLRSNGQMYFMPYSEDVTWYPITPKVTEFYEGS